MAKFKRIFIAAAAIGLSVLLGICIFESVKFNKSIADTGLKNTVPYGFGEEARVIILAGQSNAEGISQAEYLKKNTTPEQYAKYEAGFDNVYINSFSTIQNEASGFVKCKLGHGVTDAFFGPELGLAEKLNELYPDETFFIIKYAWGGTDLCNLWRSPSSGGQVGQLYTGFIQYVKNSIKFLDIKNYDVKIEALCWMQGESDSVDLSSALEYESNLTNFISDVRFELGNWGSQDGVSFVDAYISDSEYWTHYEAVNSAKQAVADLSPMNAVINTISHGLTFSCEPFGEPDLAHYDALSEIKLGHLFAEECIRFFD